MTVLCCCCSLSKGLSKKEQTVAYDLLCNKGCRNKIKEVQIGLMYKIFLN